MDTFETSFEKNVRKNLDSIFGEKSPDIKEVLRLELIDADENEKQKTIEAIKKRNERDLLLMSSNTYTYYDIDGKLRPFDFIPPIKSNENITKIINE